MLMVEDDGAGFDTSQQTPGQGLGNLGERVLSLGGALTITSSPGAGTRVEALLPR